MGSLNMREFEGNHFLHNEENYTKYFEIKPGHIVMDVGAQIGYFSCLFSQLVGPTGRVISFDPDSRTIPYFNSNIQKYALNNITFFQKGVWDKKTILKLYPHPNLGSSSVVPEQILASSLVYPMQPVEVELNTIDYFVEELKLPTVDFIKMDIEASEIRALRGAHQTLTNIKPALAIAAYHMNPDTGKETSSTIDQILKQEYGYKTYVEPGGDGTIVYAVKP